MPIITPETFDLTFPVAIVVSRFNPEISEPLLEGALQRLYELGFIDDQITTVWVPGAVEIPLIAKKLAGSHRYRAIICLGSVIRGDTAHFDYVCKQVSDGCQHVALACDLPIIFHVLMTEDVEQALARTGGAEGHRGRDAADSALEMVALVKSLEAL